MTFELSLDPDKKTKAEGIKIFLHLILFTLKLALGKLYIIFRTTEGFSVYFPFLTGWNRF